MGNQVDRTHDAALAERSRWSVPRQLASWAWTLASPLTFGLANSGLFLFAALKRRHLIDWLAEGTYITSLVLLVIASQRDREDAFDTTAAVVFFTTWLIGAGHAFAVRRSVFQPTEVSLYGAGSYGAGSYGAGSYGAGSYGAGSDGAGSYGAESYGRGTDGSPPAWAGTTIDPAIARALGARERRAQARQILAEDPRLASDLGIGRPDLARGYDDGGLVDLNTAPAAVLSARLEIDDPTTQRILTARAAISGFISADELGALAQVSPGTLDRIGDRIVFSPRE